MKVMGQFVDGRTLVEMDQREIVFLENMVAVLHPALIEIKSPEVPAGPIRKEQSRITTNGARCATRGTKDVNTSVVVTKMNRATREASVPEDKLHSSNLRRLKSRDKTCRVCKQPFVDTSLRNRQSCCSRKCQAEAERLDRKGYAAKKQKTATPAAQQSPIRKALSRVDRMDPIERAERAAEAQRRMDAGE